MKANIQTAEKKLFELRPYEYNAEKVRVYGLFRDLDVLYLRAAVSTALFYEVVPLPPLPIENDRNPVGKELDDAAY